jgi:hypothetical protein
MMLQNQASFRYPTLAGLAFANILDDLNIENGRSSEPAADHQNVQK